MHLLDRGDRARAEAELAEGGRADVADRAAEEQVAAAVTLRPVGRHADLEARAVAQPVRRHAVGADPDAAIGEHVEVRQLARGAAVAVLADQRAVEAEAALHVARQPRLRRLPRDLGGRLRARGRHTIRHQRGEACRRGEEDLAHPVSLS
ncbi:hypothetical protein [Elioraea sp.]|uniref:hypothetical protein n=1 Tax=Elioraea sp. TaxID=2185103 RepID=UPI0026100472|nr:hypothetical protein [Elioraea sp.]